MVVYASDSPPVEGIMLSEKNTRMKINTREIGIGTLYLTETVLSWFSDTEKRGMSVPWKNVIIHAKTSDVENSIYVQIDSTYSWTNEYDVEPDDHIGDDIDDEDTVNMTEFWFYPSGPDHLDELFVMMSECQVLNPDPEEPGINEGDEEADSDFEEWGHGENGSGDMQRLNIQDDEDEGQFEDAE